MDHPPRMYLPMIGRCYCVTVQEQSALARRHGLSVDDVRAAVAQIDARSLKTATKVKAAIHEALLNAVMQPASGRDS